MTETSVPPPRGRALPRPHRRRFASLRTITALILREMSTTYGRSPGGYLWAILEPAAGTLLLSAVFSAFSNTPLLGTSFALFYVTGLIPMTFFLTLSAMVAQSINFSRPLLAYPSVTWIDAILARFLLNFLTQLMVAYVLFTSTLLLFEGQAIIDLPTIALAMALCGALSLGIGALNCFLFTKFEIWQRGWSILTRPLFLISGVMLPHEMVPQPWQDYLWYNPVSHLVGLTRRGFYGTYDAPYVSIGYVLLVSGLSLLVALVFLSRYHRDMINT